MHRTGHGATARSLVIAVRDLEAAAARFAALGCRLKPGRLHPDNLLNEHLKFRDGSELELMTLAGAGAMFFVSGGGRPQDPDSLVRYADDGFGRAAARARCRARNGRHRRGPRPGALCPAHVLD